VYYIAVQEAAMNAPSQALNVRLSVDLLQRVDRVQRWLALQVPGATRTDAVRMVLARGLDLLENDGTRNEEDRAWLRADLSRLGEFEPYDFEGVDPESLGEPVEHLPDGRVLVEGR
jgi:hypothetical protein